MYITAIPAAMSGSVNQQSSIGGAVYTRWGGRRVQGILYSGTFGSPL